MMNESKMNKLIQAEDMAYFRADLCPYSPESYSLDEKKEIFNDMMSVKGKSLDEKTISSYIGYLEDAYLVAEAQRYDIKGRAYIGSPKRYYFEDVGLRNARVGFRLHGNP